MKSACPKGRIRCRKIFAVLTHELRQRYINEAMALAKAVGARHFLVDARSAPSASNPIDDYQTIYEIAHKAGLKPGTRIATLIASTDLSRRFLETAANNAGYLVRLFIDETEALAWLRSGASARFDQKR